MTVTVREVLRQGQARLTPSGTARLDAELLLARVLRQKRIFLYSRPESPVAAQQQRDFETLLQRRRAGEPVAYLLERQAFWNIELKVNADVLVPRPETELLVEQVLERAGSGVRTVADLGTGSGAIALALAAERPQWRIWASDNDEAALAVARENASLTGCEQVHFVHGDWCQALPAEPRFDFLVSNPPYIDARDPHLEPAVRRFEPVGALLSPHKGLADLQRIITDAPAHLAPGGMLLLEHGFQQAGRVRALMRAAGFRSVSSLCDLAGHERVSLGMYKVADHA